MKTIHVLTIQENSPNPFIMTLSKGIASDSITMDTNRSRFWDTQNQYDVIQIHWPEYFFYSRNNRLPSKMFAKQMTETLRHWKRKGTKIVFTRHDATTHYVDSEDVRTNLFEIIETEADAIVHLGNFSKNQMPHHNNQLHVVIPHHIYDTVYPCSFSQNEARKAIGIPEKARVVLAFGTFRDREENLLLKNTFEQLDEPDKYLFAPSWYHNGWHEYENKDITVEGNCLLGSGTVDQSMLPYCFCAADVVFVQRLRNLNSGNLFTGFLFNKTVVSPAIGNMTEYLDNIRNFSFDPFDSSSVLAALKKGLERSLYPQENEAYARKHWSTKRICEQYRQLYQQLTELKQQENREDDKPDLSVIVPVYNAEDYLETCVESLLKQRGASLEIILIDDGSTDRSGRSRKINI